MDEGRNDISANGSAQYYASLPEAQVDDSGQARTTQDPQPTEYTEAASKTSVMMMMGNNQKNGEWKQIDPR